MVRAIRYAINHGINYFDLAAGSAKAYAAYGEAFAGNRDKALIQDHFGADYRTGEYGCRPIWMLSGRAWNGSLNSCIRIISISDLSFLSKKTPTSIGGR